MIESMHFRTAFSGFNREDVVKYIEYVNARHSDEVNQLNSEIEYLKSRVAPPAQDAGLKAQLAAALAENEALKAEVAQLRERCEELETAPAAPAPRPAAPSTHVEQELEAYRRAERTERLARERASQVYAQANAVLADASLKADAASALVSEISEKTVAQMQAYQASINDAKDALQEAVSALYAIRPEE